MRNVSIQELAEDTEACIAEVEAGHKLVLMRSGKAVAEISPAPEIDQTPQLWKTEEERRAAAASLLARLNKGYDLGGFKITDRSELYEGDAALRRREAAIKRLDEIMEQGIPLGGTPPTRDEMHDGR